MINFFQPAGFHEQDYFFLARDLFGEVNQISQNFCTFPGGKKSIIYLCFQELAILFHFNPSHPNHGRREKTDLNFYFNTPLWCFKRFYDGLKGLHKTF